MVVRADNLTRVNVAYVWHMLESGLTKYGSKSLLFWSSSISGVSIQIVWTWNKFELKHVLGCKLEMQSRSNHGGVHAHADYGAKSRYWSCI